MSQKSESDQAHIEGEILEEPVNKDKPRRGRSKKQDPETPPTPSQEPVMQAPVVEILAAAAPSKWLLLTAYAPLQIVQAANYLRYGAAGVRRFGPGASPETFSQPQDIHVKFTLKQVGNQILLTYPDFVLRPSKPDAPFDLEGTNIWEGQLAAAHLRAWWVWDFYRLYSGLRLLVEIPSAEASGEWKTALDALRQLKAGDQIVMEVDSKSSPILQVYPIDRVAIETNQEP